MNIKIYFKPSELDRIEAVLNFFAKNEDLTHKFSVSTETDTLLNNNEPAVVSDLVYEDNHKQLFYRKQKLFVFKKGDLIPNAFRLQLIEYYERASNPIHPLASISYPETDTPFPQGLGW